MTTMEKRDSEVMDMTARRCLDFCCLQETGWKGEGARKMGEYKFFWMGCAINQLINIIYRIYQGIDGE